MERTQEFQDILLEDEDQNKASKFKKIALLAGIFILIFLIVLIAMKAINRTPEQNGVEQVQINSNLQKDLEIEEDPNYKQVPIIQKDEKSSDFDEIVKKLKEDQKKRNDLSNKQTNEDIKNVSVQTSDTQKVSLKEEKIQVPTQSVQKPKEEKKVEHKKPKTHVAKPKTQKPVKKHVVTSSKSTYIQVLASTSSIDKNFINLLKAKKYSYSLYKTTINGTNYTKLLVGPYNTKQEARSALPKIKKEISSSAFLFWK